MLIADMFRGMDSTGAFAVNKYGNLKMAKDASTAMSFINKKGGADFFNDFVNHYHIVVGHNRKATMGAIVEENAHPFIEGDICLVHNGTLQNHYKLANRVVDSNAVAAHINEHGYKSLLKNIEGAYALIWYNATEKTLYFTRNAERPLHFVETNDKIYIASESKMLDWILDRNEVTKVTIQNVPTDKVFKFNLETRKMECETKPKKDPVVSRPHFQHQQKQTNAHSNLSNSKTSGCGALALAFSSDNTPKQTKETKATYDTYHANETVYVKVVDFDSTDKATKLVLETLDNMKTVGSIWIQHAQWTQAQIDRLINAEALLGKISSVTMKKAGQLSLYFSTVQHDVHWQLADDAWVTGYEMYEAGNCCYGCGKVIDTEEKAKEATILTDSLGQIIYVECSECDQGTNNRHYQAGRMY